MVVTVVCWICTSTQARWRRTESVTLPGPAASGAKSNLAGPLILTYCGQSSHTSCSLWKIASLQDVLKKTTVVASFLQFAGWSQPCLLQGLHACEVPPSLIRVVLGASGPLKQQEAGVASAQSSQEDRGWFWGFGDIPRV